MRSCTASRDYPNVYVQLMQKEVIAHCRLYTISLSHSLNLHLLSTPESVSITSKDARWVGAWWLGFLVSSAFLLLSSVPFWFLPRSLPMHEGEQNKRENVRGTSEALGSNHSLKLTDIAKGFFFIALTFRTVQFFVLIQFKGLILHTRLLCFTNTICHYSINGLHFSES